MKRLCILVFCGWIYGVNNGLALDIFRPKYGVPELVEAGGVFRVEVTAAAGLSSSGWSVAVANDLRTWTNCAVQQAAYGQVVYNNSLPGYALAVQTPSDLPPEVFTLTVRHDAGGAATNRHAVSLVRCLETNFYFIHYADPQASASNALTANGANTPYGSIEELYWHAPVFNLINPRFLFNTGDELDDGNVDTVNRYRQYLTAMETLTVPVMVTRGNNDRGAFGHWKTNIGQAAWSMTMGSFYLAMNDTQSSEMSAWFTNEFASTFTNADIRYRLLGQHYHNNADSRNPYFYAPPIGRDPDLMLVGHNHAFSTIQTSPYRILSSGPSYNYGAAAVFFYERKGEGWTCSGVSNHPGVTRFYSVGDWGAPKVACAYERPNDGTSVSNTAAITNSLSFDFYDGRIRFLMRQASGGYVVTGGVILAEYAYGESNTAVDVRVNMRANRMTPVTIIRSDTDEDTMPDAWERFQFGDLTTATAHSDYDGDRMSDPEEYIAGTQPTNATSFFRVLLDASSIDSPVLNWSGWSNRLYAVSRSTNLLDGTPGFTWLTDIAGGDGMNIFTDAWESLGQAFYRVSVSLPE